MEIILTACPQDLIQAEDRQLIIRDLLQDVHDKVVLCWKSTLSLNFVFVSFYVKVLQFFDCNPKRFCLHLGFFLVF